MKNYLKMDQKRRFNSTVDTFAHKKNIINRKEGRKRKRKENKINKAIHYANLKNTNKICVSSDDVQNLKVLQNKTNNGQTTDLISLLNNKILANDNKKINNNNNNNNLMKRKGKKKQQFPKKNVDIKQKENASDETSFKMSSSTNSRLAKLQEYVNQEAKKMVEHPKKGNNSNKLRTDKLIKDEYKIKDLMQGKKNDEKEIKKLVKELRLSSYQKKNLSAYQKKNIDLIFSDNFGDILEDIEEGIFEESMYKNDLDNYTSDKNFENDMLFSGGKMNSIKKNKSTCNKQYGIAEEGEPFDSEDDDDDETELDYNDADNVTDFEVTEITNEEDDYNDTDNVTDFEVIEIKNKGDDYNDTDNVTDFEVTEIKNGEQEDLMVDSSPHLSTNKNSRRSAQPPVNSKRKESDLDVFIVDDDIDEYSDGDGEPVTKITKIKKSRIINRERSNSVDSDETESDHYNGDDNFIDLEAEESEIDEDTDGEPEDNEKDLMFESGSCLSRNKTSGQTAPPSINTIFDLYARNSEDEEEEESDLNGFIVDDDFVEYFDEDSEPVKKSRKMMKSRIINREKLSSVDSDVIEIDNDDNVENESRCKRKRIYSESECEEEVVCEVSKKEPSISEMVNVIASEPDVQKSILKETPDLNDSKSNKKKRRKKKKKNDVNAPKKRVSFTLPEDDQKLDEAICEEYHEDIYGRIRDKSGNVVSMQESEDEGNGKYISPAMRKLMALNSGEQKKEQLAQLQKKLKGQLNRLAESNMAGILSQIEMCYQSFSRNDMNDTMTKLLFEMLVTPVMTSEKLMQDYALLIAILSANVGNEIGAYILTEFVVKWVEDLEMFKSTENLNEIDSKELDNMLTFICQLYNFKVMDASFIYDILQKLLSRQLKPKEVDLILLVLRSVGFTLRKDDPLALKSLITEINVKASEGSSDQSNETYTRMKFMLEILIAIRNNNMNRVPNYDPTHSLHLKQLMKGLIRNGCRTSELKISLEDLLKSKIVGKWWIVGSAWSGGLKERNLPQDTVIDEGKVTSLSSISNIEYSVEFKKKAAKLHMAHPPRINILYAITEGATNCKEAFAKLIELRLSKNQEQEIFNVLVVCCMRCKIYKELYNDLAFQLVGFNKIFRRYLQGSLWDRFQELDDMKLQYLANLAKFVANLIAEDGLNLFILKNVNFAQSGEGTVSFVRQILLGIFLHPTGTHAVTRAFKILCSKPGEKVLCQYLRLFIVKFISPHKCEDKVKDKLLKSRVNCAVDMLKSVQGVKL